MSDFPTLEEVIARVRNGEHIEEPEAPELVRPKPKKTKKKAKKPKEPEMKTVNMVMEELQLQQIEPTPKPEMDIPIVLLDDLLDKLETKMNLMEDRAVRLLKGLQNGTGREQG